MSDKYDEAIKFLVEHPEEIFEAWESPCRGPAGCLFLFASRNGESVYKGLGKKCVGCLSQIRAGGKESEIEYCVEGMETLPVFAEWQRRLDREIRQAKQARVIKL